MQIDRENLIIIQVLQRRMFFFYVVYPVTALRLEIKKRKIVVNIHR